MPTFRLVDDTVHPVIKEHIMDYLPQQVDDDVLAAVTQAMDGSDDDDGEDGKPHDTDNIALMADAA